MLPIYTFVLLVALCSITARAQDSMRFRIGPVAGYRALGTSGHIVDFDRDTVITPASALAPFYGIDAGMDIPILPWLASTTSVGFNAMAGTAVHSRNVTFLVEGTPTSGVIKQDHDISATVLQATTGISVPFSKRASASLTTGVMIPVSASARIREYIDAPPGVTFVASGTAARALPGATLAGTRSVAMVAGIGATVAHDLGATTSLLVSVAGNICITPLVSTPSWRPWEVGLHIQLGWTPWAFPTTDAPRATVQRTVEIFDTTTIVSTRWADQPDTTYEHRMSLRTDTVRAPFADTLVSYLTLHTVRHLPPPLPFLSAVANTRIVNGGMDTLLALDVSVDVLSDTTAESVITVSDGDRIIYTTRLPGSVRQVKIPIAPLYPDIGSVATLTLVTRVVTTDAVGQRIASAPVSITLERHTPAGLLLESGR